MGMTQRLGGSSGARLGHLGLRTMRLNGRSGFGGLGFRV